VKLLAIKESVVKIEAIYNAVLNGGHLGLSIPRRGSIHEITQSVLPSTVRRCARSFHYSARSISRTIKLVGRDHPHVADTLVNIGVVYYKQGKEAEAQELFARAYKIRLDKLGPNHPDTTKLRPFV